MKKVKLSEESFNKLKNKLVNEVSHGMVDRASHTSDNIFYDLESAFDDFYQLVRYNDHRENPYIKKIAEYAEAIEDIFLKKSNQRRNFDQELNKFDYEKFYDDKDKPEEWEEDYDDLDLRMLQNKYPKNNSNMRYNGRHLEER